MREKKLILESEFQFLSDLDWVYPFLELLFVISTLLKSENFSNIDNILKYIKIVG